jgi:hypothetical protein
VLRDGQGIVTLVTTAICFNRYFWRMRQFLNIPRKHRGVARAISALLVLTASLLFSSHQPQATEPWTPKQLMQPAELAERIQTNKNTYIYSIGPSGLIKTATLVGETRDAKNLAKLRNEVSKLPKDASVVVYCGCCPFKNCPNIRPAFALLNEMGFTNHKLLNLAQNLKVDWIDKGYPMAK